MSALTTKIILGLDEGLLVEVPELKCRVHHGLVQPLMTLAAQAARAGFDLAVASSYRSFDRQLHIWNAKARGARPLLDSAGVALDVCTLTEREIVFAILRWSALPGASRHHWGTDIDVYDKSRIPEHYALQLTAAETQAGGPFAAFYQWLTPWLDTQTTGFYRPYALDSGGIAPEPWHLSYAPLAQDFAQQFSADSLRTQLQQTDIALKATILANLDEIIARFVCNER